MKEQTEKQVIQYSEKTLPELLTMAIAGDKLAAAEIVSRQEKQAAEIESLKIKANSKRAPKAEKTPADLFAEKPYYRAAKLLAAFGEELTESSEQLSAMVVTNILLGINSLATGNLRQACDRARQCAAGSKADITLNSNIPVLARSLQHMLPDENKKLKEQEAGNARLVFAVKFYEYANVQEDTKKAVFMRFWDMYISGTTGELEYIEALKNAIAEETPATADKASAFLPTMQAELEDAELIRAELNKADTKEKKDTSKKAGKK